jgi:Na+/H+ antiporter NhaD/arsenite permease-like protein
MNIEIILSLLFIVGYLAIALEHSLKINKAAPALLLATICWTVYALSGLESSEMVQEHLSKHLSSIAEIVFFLMGAMTIVELIAAHNGFDYITKSISTNKKRKLLWFICIFTFFLSAVLDNLTTSIVAVSLVRKLIKEQEERWLYASMVIIAANAGGAWSPIGDVTTTMLWIGGQVSTLNIISKLFLPSLICLLIPLLYQTLRLKGSFNFEEKESEKIEPKALSVLILGVLVLIGVPIFKTLTHLPPYIGMTLGMAILWVYTELTHRNASDRDYLKISNVLMKIDMSSILFFFGILLAVSCFEAVGMLHHLATFLETTIGNQDVIVGVLGVLSAIIDNVPLTAAVQGMYDLSAYPTDHRLWESLAYAVGTGGSSLIIGSAAGVVVMGMEDISFFWYLRRISLMALMGYLGGLFCFYWLN